MTSTPPSIDLAHLPESTAEHPAAKVVIISAVDVYPVDCGKKVVLAGFLSYFSRRIGSERVVYVHIARRPSLSPEYPCGYRWVTLPALAKRAPAIIWQALLTRRRSIQEAMFALPSVRRQIDALLAREQPTLIVFDTVRMAACAWSERWAPNSVLYLDDLFSLRYQRMLAESRVDALGSFGQYFPAWLNRVLNLQGLQRQILKAEARRIAQSERQWPRRFRRSLLISDEETSLLRDDCERADIQSVAPLLPERATTPRSFDSQRPPFDFIFLGTLNISQNEDNLYEFMARHWRECLRAMPQARLRVIGKHPSERLLKLREEFGESVSIEGFVEDLGAALASAAGLIAPLRFGGGIKLKIIDALAFGLPVVATPIGVEGIPVRHGVHAFIAEDPADFPKYMSRLCDPVCNRRMSAACRSLFKERYAENVLINRYDQLFGLDAPSMGSCA